VSEYLARRLLWLVPTLFGLALLAFGLLEIAGGDAGSAIAGLDPDPVSVQNMRHELGLDRPAPVRFLDFALGALHGDFGRSYLTHQPVADEIARRYPHTLMLALASIAFALVCGAGLGTLAALRPYSILDQACSLVALLGVSVPGFWLALMLILVFSIQRQWLPTIGLDTPQSFILPVVVMSAHSLALIARLTRAGMLEILRSEFILTARAKGLTNLQVVVAHAMKNVALPVITAAGTSFGFMLGSSVIVETVFSIDGIGSMIVNGILARDTPIVESGVLVVAINFIVITLVLDVLYARVDPRIRL
jgi:peptide/nickel transport system permease protein